MIRRFLTSVLACTAAVAFASPALAQQTETVELTRRAIVLDAPRGDSVRVGTAAAGDVLEVLGRQNQWILVRAPESSAASTASDWQRGWIHSSAVRPDATNPAGSQKPRSRGTLLLRGFGYAGGSRFAAHQSFDILLGSALGQVWGGGAQVVFPNGAYILTSMEQFEKTGSRALVSGSQVFTVDVPARITVKPLLFTLGYRGNTHQRYAPYAGAGIGWHRLTEDAPSGDDANSISKGRIGYHAVGGVEFPLGGWLSLAGEAQWATVPKALGATGLSAVFGEDDLGGATFRFKVIVGR